MKPEDNEVPGPWYVWLVWVYDDSVGFGETGPMRIVGVFSTHQKAVEAAYTGCALTILTFDEPVVGNPELPVEWID